MTDLRLHQRVWRRSIEPRLFRRSWKIEDTVVVCGSPRSGTTWLAEILASDEHSSFSNEPLNLTNHPDAKRAGFEWRTYIGPEELRPREEEYLRAVLTGQIGMSPRGVLWHILGVARTRRLIVKFVRANRMLGWMRRTFPVQAIVLVLRHPCAVVSSQVAMGERNDGPWKYAAPPDPEEIQTGYSGWIPDDVLSTSGSVLREVRSREETLAAIWCLDQYLALRDSPGSKGDAGPRVVTSYEEILRGGAPALERLVAKLGIELPDDPKRLFEKKSRVQSPDLNLDDAEEQVSKWKQRLTAAQIDGIMRVVDGFGLDFYTDDLRLDEGRVRSVAGHRHP